MRLSSSTASRNAKQASHHSASTLARLLSIKCCIWAKLVQAKNCFKAVVVVLELASLTSSSACTCSETWPETQDARRAKCCAIWAVDQPPNRWSLASLSGWFGWLVWFVWLVWLVWLDLPGRGWFGCGCVLDVNGFVGSSSLFEFQVNNSNRSCLAVWLSGCLAVCLAVWLSGLSGCLVVRLSGCQVVWLPVFAAIGNVQVSPNCTVQLI